MPELAVQKVTLPGARRPRMMDARLPEEGSMEGEFWVVARAGALLIGGIVVLGWVLS